MNTRTKRNLRVILIAVLAVVGIGLGGLFLIFLDTKTPQATAPAAWTETPPKQDCCVPSTDLKGTWNFKLNNGSSFTADISEKTIKIYMNSKSGTSALYWYGSFESYKPAGSTITSKVIDDAAILSKSTSKDFVVGNTTLSFDFSAMGNTTKVELSRV